MIDVNVWRARIGRFYSVTQKRKHGGTKMEGGRVDVTLWDILLFCVLLMFWAKCVHCAASTVFAVDSLLFVPEMQENLSRKETMTGEGIVNSEWNIDTFNQVRFVMIASVAAVGCAFNAVTSLWRILLSNDVERNPGPMNNENSENSDHVRGGGASTTTTQVRGDEGSLNADSVSRILSAIQSQTEQMQEQSKQLKDLATQNKAIREEQATQNKAIREEQATQNKAIREELIGIKEDLVKVSQTCQEITQRCSKLESESKKLSARVNSNSACVTDLRLEAKERKDQCWTVNARVDEMSEEIRRVNDEIDRLEEFSRRDNLRMHGVIPVTAGIEDYDSCARAVCEVLNEVDQKRQWTEEDIARAHRVGQARQGAPKTMLVKFQRWRDKIRLIRDRDLRDRLDRVGVRVANDLTRRQADTVTAARREGMAAYFVRGKLTVGPRRPATYTAVTADTRSTQQDSPSRHVPRHYQHPIFPPQAFPTPSRDPRGLHTSSSPVGCDVSSQPPRRSDNMGFLAREAAATGTEGDTSHAIAGSSTTRGQSTAGGSVTAASDTDYVYTHTNTHRENTSDETRKDSTRDKSKDTVTEEDGGRTEVNTNLETETYGIDGPSHTCSVSGESEGWGQGEGGEGGGKENPNSSTDKHTHCDIDSREGGGRRMEGEVQVTERVGMDEELGSVERGRGKERVERGKPHSKSQSEPREGTEKGADGPSVGPRLQRQPYRRIDSYMHPKASEQNESTQPTNRTLRSGRNANK